MSNQFNISGKNVCVVGHHTMIGSALVRRLEKENCKISVMTGVNQVRQSEVEEWLEKEKPDSIILASAPTTGGILSNYTQPADFIYENLAVETNIIHAAYKTNVQKLMFVASSCIYPRLCEQPIVESALLTAPLEPTNEWYSVAKIAGVKLCDGYRRQYGCDFISVVPTNMFGPDDDFDVDIGHVIPAMILKIHEAKKNKTPIEVWGTGTPQREFLYVDDVADSMVFLLENYSDADIVNIGSGENICIMDLVHLIADVIDYQGDIIFDDSKPDGMPLKQLDSTKLEKLGWTYNPMGLKEGLVKTYRWFLENKNET